MMGIGGVMLVGMLVSDLVWGVGTSVSDARVEAGIYITFPWVGVPSVTVSSGSGEVTITWPLSFCALNYVMLILYLIDYCLLVLVLLRYNNKSGGWVSLLSSLLVLGCNITVKGVTWAWLMTVWRPVSAGTSEISTGEQEFISF